MAKKLRPPQPGPEYVEVTPAQRAYAERERRVFDAYRRKMCTMLQFWRVCGDPQCRRQRACEKDMHACFARHWPMMPEETKVWLRAASVALDQGNSPEQAVMRGRAAVEQYLNSPPPEQYLKRQPPEPGCGGR